MRPLILARRFFASVFARPPSADEDAWVASLLLPGELELWGRQPRYDRRHTLGVARRAERALGARAEGRWVAAALLHDVGKIEAGLGILGRVVATLTMGLVGRDRVRGWAARTGWRGRFGRYADHGPIGGALVRSAGGRDEVAAWASVHHLIRRKDPGRGVDLPLEVVIALSESDRD